MCLSASMEVEDSVDMIELGEETVPKTKKRARTKNFTIQHKVLIIDLLDGTNYSQMNYDLKKIQKQECVRKYLFETLDLKLGRSTISEIYKNRDNLLSLVQMDSSKFSQKSLKTSKYHDLEVILADWVMGLRNEGCQVSGEMIQVKALEIAKSYSVEDFKASCGWLCKFKERFKLRRKHAPLENCDCCVNGAVGCARTVENVKPNGAFDIRCALDFISKELDCYSYKTESKCLMNDGFLEKESNSTTMKCNNNQDIMDISFKEGLDCLQKAALFLHQKSFNEMNYLPTGGVLA